MKNELTEIQIMAIIEKQRKEYYKRAMKTKSNLKIDKYMHMFQALCLLHKQILIKKGLIEKTDKASEIIL
jgi:hypothetical protein